eukprot:3063098-Prymnesium_polylepis.1
MQACIPDGRDDTGEEDHKRRMAHARLAAGVQRPQAARARLQQLERGRGACGHQPATQEPEGVQSRHLLRCGACCQTSADTPRAENVSFRPCHPSPHSSHPSSSSLWQYIVKELALDAPVGLGNYLKRRQASSFSSNASKA